MLSRYRGGNRHGRARATHQPQRARAHDGRNGARPGGRTGGGVCRPQRQAARPPAPLGRADRRPCRRRRHGRRRARGRLRPRRAARHRRALPRRGRAGRPSRRRRRRARVRRPPGRLERGHDDRHALRPRVDDEGAGNRDRRDDPRQPRQALADRPVATYLPHFATNGKDGVLVRDLLRYSSGLPDRQPEGRHRRRRRDLGLHGGDAPRVPDRLDGRVLGSRLPPARPPDRGRRGDGSRHVREAGDLGPARHDRHDLQPRRRARPALCRDRPGLAAPAPRPAARIGAGRPGLEGRRHRRLRRRLRDGAQRRDLQPDDPQRRLLRRRAACCPRSSWRRWSPTRRRR